MSSLKQIGRYLLAMFLTIMSLSSCDKREEPGPSVTITRTLSNYKEVEVYGAMRVDIVRNLPNEIRITAPENLIKYIETYVFSDRLTIRERHNKIKNSDIHIEISETALEYIYLNGSGTIISDSIRYSNIALRLVGSGRMDIPVICKTLNARVNGSGRIASSGQSEEVVGWVNGSGVLNLKNILAQDSEAKVEGSGLAEVFGNQRIFARVDGSGLIKYWGHPIEVDTQVVGAGRIVEMN